MDSSSTTRPGFVGIASTDRTDLGRPARDVLPAEAGDALLTALLRRRFALHRRRHPATNQVEMAAMLAAAGITVTEEAREHARRRLIGARARCTPEYWVRLRRRLRLPEQRPTGDQMVYPVGEDETYWRAFDQAMDLMSDALRGVDYADDFQMRLDCLLTSHEQELAAEAFLDAAGTVDARLPRQR